MHQEVNMSTPDAGLPFFGVQTGARGERVVMREQTIGLSPDSSGHFTGGTDGDGDVIHVAAALAVLLFRYTYEPTIVIGMAQPELRRDGASGVAIIPLS